MKTTEFLKESNPSPEEYTDEAGMVKDNLHTIIRAMKELGNSLKNNEDIPEWAQEKIAAAKGMLVSVKDYMISQHEQGVQPTVSEDASGGATSSGAVATSMGGGAGFGKSIFMSRSGTVKTKKKKK
jgi:hypothetical protein